MKVTFEVTTVQVGGQEVNLFNDLRFSGLLPHEIVVPGSPLEKLMSGRTEGNGKPISSAPAKKKMGRPVGSKTRRPRPAVAAGMAHGSGGPNTPRYGRLGITEADLQRIHDAVMSMDNGISALQRAILRQYFGVGSVTPVPLKKIAPMLGVEVWRMTPELRKALKSLGIKRKRRRRLSSTRSGGQKDEFVNNAGIE